ncbi:MAG TPA: hypothetical protein VI488_00910 [Candidatus Angelobacter sp.]
MSSIFDQIKANAVPAGVMRSAAKGALPVPPSETLEILVYLTQNPVFGLDAKMTLAGWDIASALKVLSNPGAPPKVLGYFWMETNRRPSLMPALIENPAITESMLIELAASCSREMVSVILASPRIRRSQALTEALATNPELTPKELQSLQEAAPTASETASEAASENDAEAEAAHDTWRQQHAAEIAAEEGKPFALTGRDDDEEPALDAPAAGIAASSNIEAQPSSPDPSQAAAVLALSAHARAKAPLDEKELSVLQKVARMKAGERVRMAFSGGREERLILIRDGATVVQNAVLASPKLTEPEVETFAAAKNVSENVLREIARNRRFMKNYNVGRNLVNNAKCPLDLALTLVKNLMVYDLKSLRFNKAVPETIRQVAGKLYREKTGPVRESKRR